MIKHGVALVVVGIALGAWIPVHAGDQDLPHRSGEVLLALNPGADINALAARHGVKTKKWLEQDVFIVAAEPSGSEQAVAARLSKDRDVSWAGLNHLLSVPEVKINQRSAAFVDQRSAAFVDQRSAAFVDQRSAAFVDGNFPPELTEQASMLQIKADEAHQLALGQGVTVAVVDTGITAHPMFTNKTASGHDFVDDDSNPSDAPGGLSYSHGAFVASLALLAAPRCLIMPLRAFSSDGVGAISDVYQAMIYAVDKGARVINCSFGLDVVSPILDAAVDYARSRGVLVVAAGGNDGEPVLEYPSTDSKALGTVGVDSTDIKADFSNWGPQADCSGPAVWLYGAYGDKQLAFWSGTSFTVPLVSGEAALVWSVKPRATLKEATVMILDSTDNIDSLNPAYKQRLGSGRINLLVAVKSAMK